MNQKLSILTVVALLAFAPLGTAAEQSPLSKELRDVVIYAPTPGYPSEGAFKRPAGSGAVRLRIDKVTGVVLSADLVRTTGSRVLDTAVLKTFRRWRFKPGKIDEITIPVSFTHHDTRQLHSYWGTVKSVNPPAGTITITSRLGAQIVVRTTAKTRITENGSAVALDRVRAGDKIRGLATINAERVVTATTADVKDAPR